MSSRGLSAGTVIHRRYQIQRTLGEGGFGVTYLVTDLKERTTMAMKEYFPMDMAHRRPGSLELIPANGQEDNFQRFRTRFLEEAKTIYRFRGHPNIVGVTHLFYENNTAYYVMEFIKGKDLGKVLEQQGQRVSWQFLRPIIGQVVSALAQVHRNGLIHCDISPDNIFTLDNGQVKLIDFGAAKNVAKGVSSVILLKRGYAPPEQLGTNGKLGPWTDVYALAVTVYRCLTGQLPPSAENRLASDRTVWPSQMGIATPSPQWEQALRKAMALRPEQRYQSVEQFWQALNGAPVPQPFSTPAPQPSLSGPVLTGRTGIYTGRQIPIRGEVVFGTDNRCCQVVFPVGTPGVGATHLRIWFQGNRLMVADMGSGLSTQLLSGNLGQVLRPGLAYTLPANAVLVLGSQSFRVGP
ncbi:MAG: hypothetical protein E7466_07905 [Ruminococcaceae bacterium]|nr:hypothetical protein [Oscillospiraceae bacterium]MBQ3214516.1 protein kinase [Oscillospiraceae bacterium]